MSANVLPIFSKAGLLGRVAVTAANTSSQGGGTIGTDIFLAFTADPTNGSYIDRLRFVATSSAAGTAMTQTVGRVFVSTKTSGATIGGTDTFLFQEVALPAATADATTTAPNYLEIPMQFVLPAGSAVLVTNHAAPAANTWWNVIVVGGQY